MQETQGPDMQNKMLIQAHQNAFIGTKPAFLSQSLMVFPHRQTVSLIQATASANCAAWASITSCHLGKQLLHRKAKGIKGIPPVFTEPRDNVPFQSNKFVWFFVLLCFLKLERDESTSLKKDISSLFMAICYLQSKRSKQSRYCFRTATRP